MNDDRFDEFLKSALAELDPVPPAPRDEMWAQIEPQLRIAKGRRRHWPQRRVWLGWGMGLAAMLAVGFGIGRFTATEPALRSTPARVAVQTDSAPAAATATPGSPVVTSRPAAAAPEANRTAYRLVVAQYMSSAEALLTTFRTQPRGSLDPDIAGWAGDLLTNTRMLLDSPAADDPKVAALLEDLELIIAQIARLSAPSAEEREIIRDGMNRTAVLPRLRATLPAGPSAAGT